MRKPQNGTAPPSPSPVEGSKAVARAAGNAAGGRCARGPGRYSPTYLARATRGDERRTDFSMRNAAAAMAMFCIAPAAAAGMHNPSDRRRLGLHDPDYYDGGEIGRGWGRC